ncbi:hypothetical protein [uncultured Kriegella sp.]|uniref:hypothetical protein n=1 Tax=uncultured Kriegella sp. TaxID=1798910 RepID=UPI0030D7E8B8|tara:strand:+ start:135940 stop:136497 length:558 start_codon:yes stop_codon:yes gene_type:complete
MQKIILITLLLCGAVATAQFGKNCELRQFKINIANPGIEYEMALGVNTTFDVKAGFQVALDPSEPELYRDLGFFPAIAGQYRYYYNFEKRQRNRRQVYGNSANYVAPAAAVFFPGSRTIDNVVIDNIISYAGLVTGLQRSYDSGFNFSIDVGAAYYMGSVNEGFYPVANVSIGWIISEKRWCVGR